MNPSCTTDRPALAGPLHDLAPGFTEPVFAAQASFRCLLQAMARPGRLMRLPGPVLQGLGRPADRDGRPLAPALAALLLTLLDGETRVAWQGRLASGAARAWLRFHTGAREDGPGEAPDFLVVHAEDLQAAHWLALPQGSDEAPQRGGTLLVETAWLGPADTPFDTPEQAPPVPAPPDSTRLELQGPGIETRHALRVAGLPEAFWRFREAMPARFPLGFETVLVCGDRIAALPRTTLLARG